MAVAPRRGIKNIPARAKEPGEEVTAAQPAAAPKAPEKGSLDVFDRVAPATRPEPKLTPPSAGQQDGGGKGDSAATPVAVANPAVAAAARAGEASKNREEPAFQGDPDNPADGPKEPGTDPGGRVPAGITDLTGAADKGVPTRTGAADDGADSAAPFIDSGRAALEAQVDAVLGSGEAAASAPSGSTVGSTGSADMRPKGTPADLGMTGDPGGQGGQTSIGMDVFDTALPARGVATASGELGILQGMLPASGADPNADSAAPSVASEWGRDDVKKVDDVVDGVTGAAGVTGAILAGAGGSGVALAGAGVIAAGGGAYAATRKLDEATGVGAAAVEAVVSASEHDHAARMRAVLAQNKRIEAEFKKLVAEEAEKKAAEEEQKKKEEEDANGQTPANADTTNADGSGASSSAGPTTGTPIDPDVAGHPELTAGYMAWRAAGRERLGLGTPLDGKGDTDPAREGTDSAASGSGRTDTVTSGGGSGSKMNLTIGMMDTAWRQFLVGQPVEGQTRGGQFEPSGGTLPGDMGNIDFGPDSTGQHTSDTRTDEPEDALDSLGGSGLSIDDFQQGKSSGDDSESDEESSDSESEES